MIVKQIYANWIGVVLDGHCVNASIVFPITSENMSRQLVQHKPTDDELKRLIRSINECEEHPVRARAIQFLKFLRY